MPVATDAVPRDLLSEGSVPVSSPLFDDVMFLLELGHIPPHGRKESANGVGDRTTLPHGYRSFPRGRRVA